MTKLKISIIFLIVVLIKTSFTKPIESSTKSLESTDEDEYLGFRIISNLIYLIVNVCDKSANISRKLLNDEDLLSSVEPEVLEFKQNLKKFLADFDKKDSNDMFDSINTIVSISEYYLNLSDEELTPESKLIKNLLNKYHAVDVEDHFRKNFAKYADNLAPLFERTKDYLDKPWLDWYEKFKGINGFVEQIEALSEFVKLL